MEIEVATLCRKRFEVEAGPVEQTREYSSSDHKSKEFEVLVDVAERVLFLEAGNNSLSPSQLSRFVKLLYDLVGIFQNAFLRLLILVHQLENLLLSTQGFWKFV